MWWKTTKTSKDNINVDVRKMVTNLYIYRSGSAKFVLGQTYLIVYVIKPLSLVKQKWYYKKCFNREAHWRLFAARAWPKIRQKKSHNKSKRANAAVLAPLLTIRDTEYQYISPLRCKKTILAGSNSCSFILEFRTVSSK